MKEHKHEFEPISHPSLSAAAIELGIRAAEMRECRICKMQTPYIQTKDSRWVSLFKEETGDEQNILLA